MEDILDLLQSNPIKAIAEIEKQSDKTPDKIAEYRKEYIEHDRTIRDTQVGRIQVDRTVNGKLIKEVKVPINFAKKIVDTSTAFAVGKPVTLIPSVINNLSNVVKQLWKVNRTDSLVQKVVRLCKQETQAAIQFYISDISENSLFNKIAFALGLKSQVKQVKTLFLQNDKGAMYPYFDSTGNMILFMWKYDTIEKDKTIKNIKIWDETRMFFYSEEEGKLDLVDNKIHGFDRIPIVYKSQDEPEWFDVKELIDRLETCISKLGSSNDYVAYPILLTYGEIKSLPGKENPSKVINFEIIKDDEGKYHNGDAKFLESKGAGESQKLELEKLESYIYSMSQTPNLDLDNLKALGDIATRTLEMMFLDANIKASMNEGENRTMIERIINIYISGIVTTTNTGLKTEAAALYYDIAFNSILPNDLKEAVEIAAAAKNAGLMSTKTAVDYIDMTDSSEDELALIKSESAPVKEPI